MKIYSVTQFREELNEMMSQVTVAIQGEVAEFHIAQNRFVWFSLVDAETTIKCFMLTFQLKHNIENGMEIQAIGSPTLFKKGQCVFRPRTIEIMGAGGLQKEYEDLKKRLEKEGLFDSSRKRLLPRFPKKIALVTSVDAAAYSDVLRILKNRWGNISVIHAPVQVQGAQSVASIVKALDALPRAHPDIECIILTRGGGSLEDLHAFNDEAVVRAVFASKIPVVSGVGHERDITLTDLACDVRASTPSNAAERVVPEKKDVGDQIDLMIDQLYRRALFATHMRRRDIDQQIRKLEDGSRFFTQQFQSLEQRLQLSIAAIDQEIAIHHEKIKGMLNILQAMHPKTMLQKGYSIVRSQDGKLIKKKKQVLAKQRLSIELSDGIIHTSVEK